MRMVLVHMQGVGPASAGVRAFIAIDGLTA